LVRISIVTYVTNYFVTTVTQQQAPHKSAIATENATQHIARPLDECPPPPEPQITLLPSIPQSPILNCPDHAKWVYASRTAFANQHPCTTPAPTL